MGHPVDVDAVVKCPISFSTTALGTLVPGTVFVAVRLGLLVLIQGFVISTGALLGKN